MSKSVTVDISVCGNYFIIVENLNTSYGTAFGPLIAAEITIMRLFEPDSDAPVHKFPRVLFLEEQGSALLAGAEYENSTAEYLLPEDQVTQKKIIELLNTESKRIKFSCPISAVFYSCFGVQTFLQVAIVRSYARMRTDVQAAVGCYIESAKTWGIIENV